MFPPYSQFRQSCLPKTSGIPCPREADSETRKLRPLALGTGGGALEAGDCLTQQPTTSLVQACYAIYIMHANSLMSLLTLRLQVMYYVHPPFSIENQLKVN